MADRLCQSNGARRAENMMKATLEEETETLVHLAVMVVTKPASIAKSPDISPEIAASAVDLVADHSSK